MTRVLVAGASGLVGKEILDLALEAGHDTRALIHRSPLPASMRDRVTSASWSDLDSAMKDVDVVVSSAGASVGMSLSNRAGFDRVDTPVNLRLIEAAERAKVKKMVYVSVACADRLGKTRYVRAHELVVDRLRESKLEHTIIRPTGIFGAFQPFLSMVRLRVVPNFGGGKPRTNPVHERDVAMQCVRAIDEDIAEIGVGGPDTFTRGEIFDLAMQAAKVRALKFPMPIFMLKLNAFFISLVHPRIGQFTEFMAAIASEDTLAPAVGTRRLSDYFTALARR
jgi:uncharacterized protein YbjT (DUF2867 family)